MLFRSDRGLAGPRLGKRKLVPRRGLEPPRLSALVPETSASTNSAIWALRGFINDPMRQCQLMRQSASRQRCSTLAIRKRSRRNVLKPLYHLGRISDRNGEALWRLIWALQRPHPPVKGPNPDIMTDWT